MVPYNVVPELDEQVAAVIVEPVAANMGVVAGGEVPRGLRAECDRVGALLVFDEVITGFRVDTGGARNKYDVTPDLTTFGKVIGGGLPIGAVGGGREIMETLSPLGPVFHAGTLAGNPLATAAGLAALGELGPRLRRIGRRARHLAALLRDACGAAGFLPSSRSSARSSASCAVTSRRRSTSSRRGGPTLLRSPRSSAMLDEGVAMAPGAYEAIFVGMAHTDEVVEAIGEAAPRAAAARPAR